MEEEEKKIGKREEGIKERFSFPSWIIIIFILIFCKIKEFFLLVWPLHSLEFSLPISLFFLFPPHFSLLSFPPYFSPSLTEKFSL